MLIDFSVANYRSFKDKVRFSMESVSKLHSNEYSQINTFYDSKRQAEYVKASAIIGKNAGGKSNFIRALVTYIQMVAYGTQSIHYIIDGGLPPFKLSKESQQSDTQMEATFAINDDTYRYGFAIRNFKVVKENLSIKKGRWTSIYTRESNTYQISSSFDKNITSLIQFTRPEVLFINVLAQFNIDFAVNIQKHFMEDYLFLIDDRDQFLANNNDTSKVIANNEELRKKVAQFLSKVDLDIHDISITQADPATVQAITKMKSAISSNVPNGFPFEMNASQIEYQISFPRKMNDCDDQTAFSFSEVSAGTRHLYQIAGIMVKALDEGKTVIIDEIEHNMHHQLLVKLLSMFNSINENPQNAQIIFSTHDIMLLDEDLRRDQFWIVDKNEQGESQLYNLAEMKGITNKMQLLKQYLLGVFGGVPKI